MNLITFYETQLIFNTTECFEDVLKRNFLLKQKLAHQLLDFLKMYFGQIYTLLCMSTAH